MLRGLGLPTKFPVGRPGQPITKPANPINLKTKRHADKCNPTPKYSINAAKYRNLARRVDALKSIQHDVMYDKRAYRADCMPFIGAVALLSI